MKHRLFIGVALLATSTIAWLQVAPAPARGTADMMPGGALLYLEAKDFSRLLQDWNSSKVKSDWLNSTNYQVFAESNLLTKLTAVHDEYSKAAGFVPGMPELLSLAGTESALALYEIRDVEFLYITKLAEPKLAATPLWPLRDQFERREVAGQTFYLRTDAATKRTVAFAFSKDYLIVGTRDDLVAAALKLQTGARDPSIASERWYAQSVQAAGTPGELRMVLNLEPLVRSSYFRSYWIQRNASTLKQYWAGTVDLQRTSSQLTEQRVFLRPADRPAGSAPPRDPAALNALMSYVPPNAGLYRAWSAPPVDQIAALIEQKLLAPKNDGPAEPRYAPPAAADSSSTGTEADLETRIDEPPLPSDATGVLATAPLRDLLKSTGIQAALQVQSSVAYPGQAFLSTPSVIVLAAPTGWDVKAVESALARSIEYLVTTQSLGIHWNAKTAGSHTIDQLDGLASLCVAAQGNLLFLSNDPASLGTVLDRSGQASPNLQATYTAGFRHARERANYHRIMSALDTVTSGRGTRPPLFSGNLGSISDTLAFTTVLQIATLDRDQQVNESVIYYTGR